MFLLGLLFLSLFVQVIVYYLQNDYLRTLSYAEELKQHKLCTTLAEIYFNSPATMEDFSFTYKDSSAQVPLTVRGMSNTSQDNLFAEKSITFTTLENSRGLKKLYFYPSQNFKELGSSNMFISKYAIVGTEHLASDILYTSGGSFTMPDISYLSDKAYTTIDMSTLHANGFSNKFIYLTEAKIFTYNSTAQTTKGNALLACKNEVVFKNKFNSSGKLILICNNSVTLESNVTLSNVLIIAKGNVSIGPGCKVKGVIFSSSRVKILGNGTFTHDPSVVANYESAYFIV